jgi:hypothetical protein
MEKNAIFIFAKFSVFFQPKNPYWVVIKILCFVNYFFKNSNFVIIKKYKKIAIFEKLEILSLKNLFFLFFIQRNSLLILLLL